MQSTQYKITSEATFIIKSPKITGDTSKSNSNTNQSQCITMIIFKATRHSTSIPHKDNQPHIIRHAAWYTRWRKKKGTRRRIVAGLMAPRHVSIMRRGVSGIIQGDEIPFLYAAHAKSAEIEVFANWPGAYNDVRADLQRDCGNDDSGMIMMLLRVDSSLCSIAYRSAAYVV